MANRENDNLLRKCRDQTQRIKETMDKLISTALSHKHLTTDFPDILDKSYDKTLEKCLDNLITEEHKAKRHYEAMVYAFDATDNDALMRLEDFNSREPPPLVIENHPMKANLQSVINFTPEVTANEESSVSVAESGDGDIMVSSVTESRMDPLTKRPIVRPVKNKRCGHIYCYNTIIPHMRGRTFPSCPIAGCKLPHIVDADLQFI